MVVAGLVAAIPEELVAGSVIVGAGLLLNAFVDLFIKPGVFDAWGLNAPKKEADERP